MPEPSSSAPLRYPDLLRMDGKVAVVLGAGQGIGAEASCALAQAGAMVVCVDREADRAAEVAQSVQGVACVADCLHRDGMAGVFKAAVERFGGVDAVVDVIGVATPGPLGSLDDEAWAAQYDIVVRHAWLALQLGSRAMRGREGSFAFVGSLAGVRVMPDLAAYGSAKAALHHLVAAAAVEYGARGIRVNAVLPGYVRTPRLLSQFSSSRWAAIGRSVPLGRPCEPSEIASVLLFLSSALARYVTGHLLVADGGAAVMAPPVG